MTEHNYTKGEWHIVHEINVEAENGRGICSCGFQSNSNPAKTFKENQANAQLISASPDMYEAIKEFKLYGINAHTAILMDKALAKAEGKG